MKSPSFNFYPNNWLGSSRVSTMTPAQEGAYIRLLCYQWNSEDQTIPDDDESLAMLSRLGPAWIDCKRGILKCFHPVEGIPAALRNERLFHEFERIDSLRKLRSSGGKKGMHNRWKTQQQQTNKPVISKLQDSNNREQGTGNREQGTEKIEQGTEKQPPIVSDKPKRATWLTPYAEAWEEAFGGDMACGKESAALRAMEKKHGTEKTLAAWKAYLSVTESRFASAVGLQKGFGEHTGEKEINRDSRQRSGANSYQHRGIREEIKIKRLN